MPSQQDECKSPTVQTLSSFHILCSVQEIEHYVHNNSDVNQRDKHGNTPLIVCCQVGNKRAVKLFLKAGADANASNVRQCVFSLLQKHLTSSQHQGNTALHYSHKYGYLSLAEFLITKGADDTMLNARGQTCYDQGS
jgi:ankyrin repeat protein